MGTSLPQQLDQGLEVWFLAIGSVRLFVFVNGRLV